VGRLHPDATADAFPRRNGLEEGTLYVWAADVVGVRTPADFAGTGASLAGTFVPIEVRDEAAAGSPGHDAAGYKDEDTLKTEALETLGAFAFKRPEDLATDPADATVAVLAATGAALDIDGWGAVYLVDVDFSSTDAPTARISILHDGNDLRDDGIRNPDNLDWADNGSIYVQEDKAIVVFGLGSGRDSSIYELDPSTGAFGVIA
jgi:secreted PhoX family phosphatase